MKVLIVDDEPDALKQTKQFLEDRNDRFSIETTTSPKKALKALKRDDYDAVVSEYKMAEMSGTELLKALREKINSQIPFIFFAKEDNKKIEIEALNLGADYYLKKDEDQGTQLDALAEIIINKTEAREAKKKSRPFLEESPLPTALKDREFRYIFANEQYHNNILRKEEETIGKTDFDFMTEERAKQNREKDKKVLDSGKTVISEETYGEKNFEVYRFPIEIVDGGTGIGTIMRSLRPMKIAEDTRLKSLLENTADPIYMVDQYCRYVLVNSALLSSLEKEKSDVIGFRFHDFHSDKESREFEEEVRKVFETDESIKEQHYLEEFDKWVLRTLSPVKDPESGKILGVSVVSSDITERKKMEEKLSRERNLLRTLLQNAPDRIYFKDKNHRFLRVSKAHSDYLGLEDPSEAIGKTDADFFPQEDVEEWHEDENKIMETGEPVTVKEEKDVFPDGHIEWVSTSKAPLYDEDGNIIGTFGISRNVTERKKAEERTEFLHSLLRHDVRNKAQVALGYLDMIIDSDSLEEVREMAKRSMSALDAGNDLIEKVGMLRKIDREEEVGKIDLDGRIRKAVKKNEDAASEEGMEIEYEGVEAEVEGTPLLEECFSNLIENSIKHSGGERIRITGEEEEDTVTVSVEDDGKGIPDDMKEKVFERSYSGESSRGTGMGNYLVKMIAQACGGDATVKDSELGGAKFDITLNKV